MIITQRRIKWTDNSTLSQWFIDGDPAFYSNKYDDLLPIYALEDKDWGLYSYMSDKEILKIKIPKETAIPYGKYEVQINLSNRFGKLMPILLGVKGFSGVRFHNGSFITDTEGCPLIGYKQIYLVDKKQYMVSKSVDCFNEFMPFLTKVLKKEKVFLDIVK